VASTYAGEHLILTVRDEGRGMTPQQIRDIGAYRQFDREKYEQQGMGLGLYIAQRLTELYQGGFMVRSESGKGTTVEVRLPVPPPLPRLRNNQRTELRFGLRASPKGLSLAAPWKKASARGCD
jgi:signal transduction histidine kinase